MIVKSFSFGCRIQKGNDDCQTYIQIDIALHRNGSAVYKYLIPKNEYHKRRKKKDASVHCKEGSAPMVFTLDGNAEHFAHEGMKTGLY